MNLSTVKGYLGELLVKDHLEDEGLPVEHLGNQSGYDLQFENLGKIVKIDVKFSVLKYEYDVEHENWGWALLHQNKKRESSCTHIVCVAVDDEYDVVNYYVVPRANVRLFPSSGGRFSRVSHGFLLFRDDDLRVAHESWASLYKKSLRLLQAGKVICVGKDGRLSDALLATLQIK